MDKSLAKRVFIEFIGTFIFLGVVVATMNRPNIAAFAIGLSLTIVIIFGGNISGGYFNPAISIMMLLNKNKNYRYKECILYIVAQILGGLCAYSFIKFT